MRNKSWENPPTPTRPWENKAIGIIVTLAFIGLVLFLVCVALNTGEGKYTL